MVPLIAVINPHPGGVEAQGLLRAPALQNPRGLPKNCFLFPPGALECLWKFGEKYLLLRPGLLFKGGDIVRGY